MPLPPQLVVHGREPALLKDLTLEELQNPLVLFKLFITDNVLSDIAKQTKLYYSQRIVERGEQGRQNPHIAGLFESHD